MKFLKYAMILVLALAMMCTMFVACGDEETPEETTTTAADGGTTAPPAQITTPANENQASWPSGWNDLLEG